MKKFIATLTTLACLCNVTNPLHADVGAGLDNNNYGQAYQNSSYASSRFITPVVIGTVIALGIVAAVVVNDNSSHSHH
jgi:hypothetical protein